MKRLLRFLSVLIAALILLSRIPSCGNSGSSETESESIAETETKKADETNEAATEEETEDN